MASVLVGIVLSQSPVYLNLEKGINHIPLLSQGQDTVASTNPPCLTG